ncbi:uncharacterized protein [Anabrus simplex]|uniref:uncharacterized protein n=1 Tax=Anabrus simplex TaxID=316456 RepID=UPI0034DCF801
MAGCLGHNREGSISPETVKRWADNINNVLATSKGRTNFRTYLDERELEDANLITFWEMCHQLAPEEVKPPQNTVKKHEKRSWFFSSKKTLTNKAVNLQNEAQEILTFAEEHVNLDFGYLQRLHRAIEDGNREEILYRVWEAKQAAVGLLETTHCQFSQHLLGERGMLK